MNTVERDDEVAASTTHAATVARTRNDVRAGQRRAPAWPGVLRRADLAGRWATGAASIAVRTGSRILGTDGPAWEPAGRLVDVGASSASALRRRTFDVLAVAAVPVEAAGAVAYRAARRLGAASGLDARLHAWAAHGRPLRVRDEQLAVDGARQLVRMLATLVVEEIDVNRIAAGVDLDAVVARVDVEAVVARVDVGALAARVLDDVDIGRIVRESTSSMSAETVDAVRAQGERADEAVSRIVDRLLLRRTARIPVVTDAEAMGADTGRHGPADR